MPEYLAGIDVGTSGVKAMIADPDGNIIAISYEEYQSNYPKTNWVEQDTELVIGKTFVACRKAIYSSKIDPKSIISVVFLPKDPPSLLLIKTIM